jgi:hypothetical protein
MSEKRIHNLKSAGTAPYDEQVQLNLTLYSNSDDAYHQFRVPAQMTVAAFVELALERLSAGGGAERVRALKRYYQPVLELQERGGERELPSELSLADSGVSDAAVCRIAARPLKERLMFCSYG